MADSPNQSSDFVDEDIPNDVNEEEEEDYVGTPTLQRVENIWQVENFSSIEDQDIKSDEFSISSFKLNVKLSKSPKDDKIICIFAFSDLDFASSINLEFSLVAIDPVNTMSGKTQFFSMESTKTIQFSVGFTYEDLIDNGLFVENDILTIKIALMYQEMPKIDLKKDEPKEKTGYVGLKNQGATCYMNSMLQSLYHIPAFRRIVYNMATSGTEDAKVSIPLNLQRLFCKMQLSESPCSTKALTTSFGWGDMDTIMQHDVQEFSRVLMTNLENKMKGTELEHSIAGLFRGKTRSFIRCKNVEYETSKIEEFYDLQMDVKGCPHLLDSFKKYTETEELSGDNQYNADNFGKQDAIMGVEFVEFPPILHIHLRRFEYDFDYERMIKINDSIVFPAEIDLSPFLSSDSEQKDPQVYELFGVLVHHGSAGFGHYYAFLRTSGDKQWYEFDDSSVSKATFNQAVINNYGQSKGKGSSFSGYMLVYVRKSEIESIFSPIAEVSIPQHLRDFFHNWNEAKKNKAAQKEADSNFVHFQLFTDDDIRHQTMNRKAGFSDIECATTLKIEKNKTIEELYNDVSTALNFPSGELRLWLTTYSKNPYRILPVSQLSVSNLQEKWTLGVTLYAQRKHPSLPIDVTREKSTIYLKFFLPIIEFPMQYIGSFEVWKEYEIKQFIPTILDAIGLPEGTKILLFEESIKGTAKSLNLDKKFSDYEVLNGHILICQISPEQEIPPFSFIPYEIKPQEKNVDQGANSTNEENKESESSKENENQTSGNIDTFKDIPTVDFSFESPEKITVDQYLDFHNYFTKLTVINIDDPSTPLLKISFIATISFSELKQLIIKNLNLDLDPAHDTLLLYQRDYISKQPFNSPIDASIRTLPKDYFFSVNSDYSEMNVVFFQAVYGVDEESIGKMALYEVHYAFDGIHPTVYKVLHEKKAKCQTLYEEVLKMGAQPGQGVLRFSEIKECRYFSSLTSESTMTSTYSRLRIDCFPEEFFVPNNEKCYIEVGFYKKTRWGNLSGTGHPIFLRINLEDKLSDIEPLLCEIINVDSTELKKKYQFFVPSVEYYFIHEDKQIKDTDVISKVLGKDKNRMGIIIREKNEASPKSTFSEAPVKIYN